MMPAVALTWSALDVDRDEIVLLGVPYRVKVSEDYTINEYLECVDLARRFDRLDRVSSVNYRTDLLWRMCNLRLYDSLPDAMCDELDESEMLAVLMTCNRAAASEQEDEEGSRDDWSGPQQTDYGHLVSCLMGTYGNTPAEWMDTQIRWLNAANANTGSVLASRSLRQMTAHSLGAGLVKQDQADRIVSAWQREAQGASAGPDPRYERPPTFEAWEQEQGLEPLPVGEDLETLSLEEWMEKRNG